MGAVESLCSSGILLNRGLIESAGRVTDIIRKYLGKGTPGEIEVDHPVVKRIAVFQRDTSIVIRLTYEKFPPSATPFLGFLIADESGNVLFGSNPALARNSAIRRSGDISRGSVEAVIDSPILMTGCYVVSIFFGDGTKDMFVGRDCLTLEYVSQAYGYDNVKTGYLGRIVPKVEFTYYEE